MFDRDKTGSIATNMMSTILRTLGQTFEESDLEILISEIDADGMIYYLIMVKVILINRNILITVIITIIIIILIVVNSE